jgi:hypothetical protein
MHRPRFESRALCSEGRGNDYLLEKAFGPSSRDKRRGPW